MNVKARAKINLTLDVTGIRDDGYHDLKMIMQTVELYDKVYIKEIAKSNIKLKSNIEWLPVDDRNLAYKAAEILKNRYNIKKGIFIELSKSIPVAAGLAGGSADCAAVLYGMNVLFDIGISKQELMNIALELGSDVPYCLMRGTALAEGRGEILTKLSPCPKAWVVLAKPPVGMSTASVYKAIDAFDSYKHPNTEAMIDAIEKHDITAVAKNLSNVLENASIPMCSMIADLKETLNDCGALGSLMSGSGPTVYGLFEKKASAENAVSVIKKKFEIKDVFLTKIYNIGGDN
ncbi:MAG: 4-(cytidine 5'-diphospho)-2-C-methyl-D-erythritol kinase [Candidatus Metalachnospira sp.]|nr:4-(cytidine 5'-diphospho)-2-C-methyl-D-erythritol kinase [Candidatus Metalachnospira sp.]